MSAQQARKLILPTLRLTETCGEQDAGADKIMLRDGGVYFVRSVADEVVAGRRASAKWVPQEFNWFPVVLDRDGRPWDVAVLYILNRLQGQVTPNMTTYQGIADDLSAYLAFLEDNDIDYTEFPQNKLRRPTYRFHGYLKNRMFDGAIAASTAKRRMGAVIGFYRWMVIEGVFRPDFALWQEHDRYLAFKDSKGFSIGKKVRSTDVAIRAPKQHDPYDGAIDDGGKLRPLSLQEQQWLVDALASLGNPEMTLIHAIMLATGARIQTVLTLRVRHAMDDLAEEIDCARMPVGPGTGIDTKYDKRMVLHIPRWLYDRMRTYAYSDRARRRREKTSDSDIPDQYLFLTQ